MYHASNFFKGVGVGLLVGAATTAFMLPTDKRKLKSGAGRALRAVGHVLDSFS
ncbi:MAG: hypothetical protein LBT60_03440 [Oscillospiraceae bacterium]|nr:hypothetical protein [Oscillospiraceae bacterium]